MATRLASKQHRGSLPPSKALVGVVLSALFTQWSCDRSQSATPGPAVPDPDPPTTAPSEKTADEPNWTRRARFDAVHAPTADRGCVLLGVELLSLADLTAGTSDPERARRELGFRIGNAAREAVGGTTLETVLATSHAELGQSLAAALRVELDHDRLGVDLRQVAKCPYPVRSAVFPKERFLTADKECLAVGATVLWTPNDPAATGEPSLLYNDDQFRDIVQGALRMVLSTRNQRDFLPRLPADVEHRIRSYVGKSPTQHAAFLDTKPTAPEKCVFDDR